MCSSTSIPGHLTSCTHEVTLLAPSMAFTFTPKTPAGSLSMNSHANFSIGHDFILKINTKKKKQEKTAERGQSGFHGETEGEKFKVWAVMLPCRSGGQKKKKRKTKALELHGAAAAAAAAALCSHLSARWRHDAACSHFHSEMSLCSDGSLCTDLHHESGESRSVSAP